ncbi:MAG: endonuclease III [Oscillospiraceae bacterium]|nr:endonuclease III [Oscillospiraceae bacterium]
MTRINTIIRTLKRLYPSPRCELNYSRSTPHELLIATRLSAQCTDKRVNIVTPQLFAAFRTIADFANANVADIENIIKSCGLYKTKAADIKEICASLLENHGGVIPDNMDSLLELPGVGRKTANLILGELYGFPAVVADTHVIRLSNRLGLVSGKNAFKVEMSLREQLPPEESLHFCHRLVLHGREVCKARKPDCEKCGLSTNGRICEQILHHC